MMTEKQKTIVDIHIAEVNKWIDNYGKLNRKHIELKKENKNLIQFLANCKSATDKLKEDLEKMTKACNHNFYLKQELFENSIPKEEYDKLKKELKETEDDRDYFESESETYDCDELEDEIEELQKNSIPKEEVRKVLNEELRYGEKVYTFGEYLDGCVETIERIKKQLLGEK